MAVDLGQKGMVGCCYYVAREERMYSMEDMSLGGVEVVDARKHPMPEVHGVKAYSAQLGSTLIRQ